MKLNTFAVLVMLFAIACGGRVEMLDSNGVDPMGQPSVTMPSGDGGTSTTPIPGVDAGGTLYDPPSFDAAPRTDSMSNVADAGSDSATQDAGQPDAQIDVAPTNEAGADQNAGPDVIVTTDAGATDSGSTVDSAPVADAATDVADAQAEVQSNDSASDAACQPVLTLEFLSSSNGVVHPGQTRYETKLVKFSTSECDEVTFTQIRFALSLGRGWTSMDPFCRQPCTSIGDWNFNSAVLVDKANGNVVSGPSNNFSINAVAQPDPYPWITLADAYTLPKSSSVILGLQLNVADIVSNVAGEQYSTYFIDMTMPYNAKGKQARLVMKGDQNLTGWFTVE